VHTDSCLGTREPYSLIDVFDVFGLGEGDVQLGLFWLVGKECCERRLGALVVVCAFRDGNE